MKLTDSKLVEKDGVSRIVETLKNNGSVWFDKNDIYLFHDADCVTADTVLECNIYGKESTPQIIVFIAIEASNCGERLSMILERHKTVQTLFHTGSVLYGDTIKYLFVKHTPTGDIAAMEIENLKRELHAYISELGFEFPNGYSIERSVVMSVPVFYKSWGFGDYEID